MNSLTYEEYERVLDKLPNPDDYHRRTGSEIYRVVVPKDNPLANSNAESPSVEEHKLAEFRLCRYRNTVETWFKWEILNKVDNKLCIKCKKECQTAIEGWVCNSCQIQELLDRYFK